MSAILIQTTYRDIPGEEFLKCIRPGYRTSDLAEEWERLRGKPIQILTPSVEMNSVYWGCNGPIYRVVGSPWCVCPHMAEIGD